MKAVKKNARTNENGAARGLGRRDLMKMGAGVVMTSLAAPRVSAQAPSGQTGPVPYTRRGWVNDANRISGNGPMDEPSRQIARWVSQFSEKDLTPSVLHTLNRTFVDSIACVIAGFESEPARISAKLARRVQSDEKATVFGYGVVTSPERAAFANCAMLRHADFNDTGPGNHTSDNIAGLLAIAESLHSTGTQTLVATVIAYELAGALGTPRIQPQGSHFYGGGWDDQVYLGATSMACGKLMGLNEDQLANALSLAIVPHMPMSVTHTGALSHWKGTRPADNIKHAVWAAQMAREGMTGPPEPFQGRNGFFDHTGAYRELRLPVTTDGKFSIERMGTKRTPTEASSQATLELIPDIKKWTTVDEIASIRYEMPFGGWQEIADPPKFDPRNRETADHSMPYMLARALMDGYIYLDSFTPEKFLDPAVGQLMDKMTFYPNREWSGNAPARIIIKKKSGEERMWDSFGGRRNAPSGEVNTPMTDQEIFDKWNRVCEFMHVDNAQRDKGREQWWNLSAIRDIAEPIATLAKFGRPLPL